MKRRIQWTITLLSGIAIIGIAVFIIIQPPSPEARDRQRTPNGQAASSAVQAALQHAAENENVLPSTLNERDIRSKVPDRYDKNVPVDRVIYLPPENRSITDLPAETVLVIVPHEKGDHVGYVSGFVRFYSVGANIQGAQPGEGGNSEHPGAEDASR